MEPKSLSINTLSEIVGGRVGTEYDVEHDDRNYDDDAAVTGAAPVVSATAGDATFIADARSMKSLATTRATVVILRERDITKETATGEAALIFVENPHLAMAKAMEVLRPTAHPAPGIAPGATIHDSTTIGADVSIGANAVIEEGARIGDRTVIYPGVYIGHDVEIGPECVLYPNISIMDRSVLGARVIIHAGTVVGSDGFGYAKDGVKYHKIPQTGIVRIADDVEIGASVTIDRAMLGETTIGRGTKIDNLVQIAHNVQIGEDTIIVAQVGIAGSSTVGARVQLGGQVGVVGHVSISDDILIGARGVVTNNLTKPGAYSGFPAINHGDWLRATTISQKLPELRKRVRELEQKINELEED
ncbi:MAG: UDP-3-O-(3-hydroxymyristoyl)glucosamine N-acyltransferase [Proteobacteria bacterium]|nr:UDP-3-O-(3-hydroxymyristoyl)glucosamine N-acyltransferase [Pseudomonadota bacterium]